MHLSDVAAMVARSLILPWVEGKGVSFDVYDAGLITTNSQISEAIFAEKIFVSDAGLIPSNVPSEERIGFEYQAA